MPAEYGAPLDYAIAKGWLAEPPRDATIRSNILRRRPSRRSILALDQGKEPNVTGDEPA